MKCPKCGHEFDDDIEEARIHLAAREKLEMNIYDA